MSVSLPSRTYVSRLQQFLQLTKPRVISLIVFTAVIGMFLAVPGEELLSRHFWTAALFATLGIALVAGSAAAVNCLVEQKIDAVMARTRARPLPMGTITSQETLLFSGAVGAAGLTLLYVLVNPLTMWLTLATFVGYAVVSTGFASIVRESMTWLRRLSCVRTFSFVGSSQRFRPPITCGSERTGRRSSSNPPFQCSRIPATLPWLPHSSWPAARPDSRAFSPQTSLARISARRSR